MMETIEKLVYKIGEGIQASSLSSEGEKMNVFYRTVITHESSDLSFIIGLVSTGLRGSAILHGEKVISNYNQLLTAARLHIPIVVNTSARTVGENSYSTVNNYSNINAVQNAGCFQFVATSLQEEIYLTLAAYRIAELSLIPGMVIADYNKVNEEIKFPDDEKIKKYLGNPDDLIPCPTPAQEMIFGKTRRRIPNWFNLDVPVMMGSKKGAEAMSLETAANQKYFYDHLPELIKQAFWEFKEIVGVDINPVTSKGKSSDFILFTIGGQMIQLYDKIAERNKKIKIVGINQLNPFPYQQVNELVKGIKAITILENISGSETAVSTFYYQIAHALKGIKTRIYRGKYSSDLDEGSLEMAIQHMVSNQPTNEYYLGINFTKQSSDFPKHEILLQEIEKQYPEINNESIKSNTPKSDKGLDVPDEIPLAVRMYKDHGPNYSKLSRFYNNTAFFYEHNDHDELVADPFAAVPVVPGASASLFNKASEIKSIPVIDFNKCSGCGDCFIQCPHSALPPIAIGLEPLIKAGISMASSKGHIILKLTPMIKNLAKIAEKKISDTSIRSVKEFLPSTFEYLVLQMGLEGEKLESAQKEFSLVMDEIADFQVAITDTFFTIPDSIEKGNGELFSLAVNPGSCTGCSICVQACEEEAIQMEAQDSENLSIIKKQFNLWEQLPDTPGDTINRLYRDKDYPSLAAMLLSRSYYMTMTGASNSEMDNAYKTLLHIITSTAESVVQPRMVRQLKRVHELIDSISENVHDKLSKALPKDNLDALSRSFKNAQGGKKSISDVVHQISEHEQEKMIDTADLSRKTDLVEALKNLEWVLSEGPTGMGRSRFGMVLAGSHSMEWAKRFPSNNFTSPSVIQWNGSAPDQSLGLFYGQLRYLLDNMKLMRRAELESKDKYDPPVHDPEIAALKWEYLTEEEKKTIPPVLLIAERDDLNESSWSSLNKLLAGKYPVKVFLLDHIDSPNKFPVESLAQTNSGLFSTIALKNAFVFQGGMGNADHLFDGLLDGLDRTYPSIFNLYATKFEKHGVVDIDWSPFAALALNSRAFPALRYDPGKKSDFLNGAINLDGNKEQKMDWVQEEITLENEEIIEYKISWADWAFTQVDWKCEFEIVESGSTNLLVPDFIRLDTNARKGRVPVIARSDKHGLKYYSVSEKVVEMTEAVLSNWNTLQEIAGLLTEFPSKLRTEVSKELSIKYELEISELKKNFDQQLKDQEDSQTEVLRQKLKEKLIALSSMAARNKD